MLIYLNKAEAKGGKKITFKRLEVEMVLFFFSVLNIPLILSRSLCYVL